MSLYLQTTISQSVAIFQTQSQVQPPAHSVTAAPFTPQQLGDMLVEAVKDKTPTEVLSDHKSVCFT